MRHQIILEDRDKYEALEALLLESGAKHIFLVCGGSIRLLELDRFFQNLPRRTGIKITRFSGFSPNPSYDCVMEGLRLFRQERCDMVAAVGGGSAMDVAKCVKLFGRMEPERDCLKQEYEDNGIRLLAVPTTAGSGSEATRFAVVYRQGVKLSVASEFCIPDTVLLDPAVLKALPEHQRKCTMLDALCHALESFWSVNATAESRDWSKQSIKLFLTHREGYLHNTDEGNAGMQRAAYLAGRAIDLAQTTAGHAMAYGLTSRYGLAHGQAVAMCVNGLWPFMAFRVGSPAALGGAAELKRTFQELAETMGQKSMEDAILQYAEILNALNLPAPAAQESDIPDLVQKVNLQRLKNNPIALDPEEISSIYRQILL